MEARQRSAVFSLVALSTLWLCTSFVCAETHILTTDVQPVLKALLAQEDTDHDGVITVRDRGPKRFLIQSVGTPAFEVAGVTPLANLLEELTLAQRKGQLSVELSSSTLYAPMPERLQQLIATAYVPALTRKLDDEGVARLLRDVKVSGKVQRIYVPADDRKAREYYEKLAERRSDLHIQVVPLAKGAVVSDDEPGILSLAFDRHGQPLSYVVPGGRFNELYGWDSFFIVLGLLYEHQNTLAQNMVDHFIYEINHYGKILNANRSYYLTRSQPPFLTSMVLAVYQASEKSQADHARLREGIAAAIQEYETVWSTGPHRTTNGLARYWDESHRMPPETEPGAFNTVLAPFAQKAGVDVSTYAAQVRAGQIQNGELDAYFTQDRAMRESGQDSSVRFRGRAANLNPVDLNSLLYRYERDIANTLQTEFGDHFMSADHWVETSALWSKRAENRKRLVNRYMWDSARGLYGDYDFVKRERTAYIGAATFYPLWAGLADQKQADSVFKNALPLLESAGGLLAGTAASRGTVSPEAPQGQWDYPFGWAPHQILLWEGLQRYGRDGSARRMVYRWLYMVIQAAAENNGLVVEKYDVINRSAFLQAEYGNVGLGFQGLSDGGFGWTNASIEIGLDQLNETQRASLDKLVPPEWVSSSAMNADVATQRANFMGDLGKAKAIKHWSDTTDVAFVNTTGNSRGQTYSVRNEVDYNYDPYTITWMIRGLGAESLNVPSAEQYETNEKVDYKLNTRNYLFETVGWSKDRFAAIAGHYEGFAGFGQHWIDRPKDKLDGEAGVGYVYENRIEAPLDNFWAWRGFSVYAHHFTNTSFFSQNVEWLINLTNGHDFRVKADSSITTTITTHLSLKLDYVISHVNNPPMGVVADDTTTSVTLSSKF